MGNVRRNNMTNDDRRKLGVPHGLCADQGNANRVVRGTKKIGAGRERVRYLYDKCRWQR